MDERTKTKDEDYPRDHIISAGHNRRRRPWCTVPRRHGVARLLGHTQDSIKSSAAAAGVERENPSLLLKERENIRDLTTSTCIQYFFHHCYGVSKRSLRPDAFQFPLHCALVSVRRADKKVLPATLPLTDQLLLRARRTELNFYGQGGNSFHHTLRYGHIGHTPNANPLGIIQQLRGPILTTYHPQMDNCGHFTYYLTCEEERTFY